VGIYLKLFTESMTIQKMTFKNKVKFEVLAPWTGKSLGDQNQYGNEVGQAVGNQKGITVKHQKTRLT